MIYREYGLIYFHIPRTSGKSMQFFLGGKIVNSPHIKSLEDRKLCIEGLCGDTLTVIRNPLDRFRSIYTYFRKGGNGDKYDTNIGRRLKDMGLSDFARDPFGELGEEAVRRLRMMLKSQRSWVFEGDKRIVDLVVPLDEVAEFSRCFAKKFGVPREYPLRNTSASELVELKREDVELISAMYYNDIVMYDDFKESREWESSPIILI